MDFRQKPFYVPPIKIKSIKTYAQVYQLQLYLLFYTGGKLGVLLEVKNIPGRSLRRRLLAEQTAMVIAY